MKKFVLAGAAVLTVAVGIAFAGTLTTYYSCGHSATTQINGNDTSVSVSEKCPSCKRADAARSHSRNKPRSGPIYGRSNKKSSIR